MVDINLIFECESIESLIKTPGYKILMDKLNTKLSLYRKESEQPEGNKDYLTGICRGIHVVEEIISSVLQNGETERQITKE